jgi:hypothetical protein
MPRSGADGGAFVFGTCPARVADGRAHTGAQRPRVCARRSPLGFPAAVGPWGKCGQGAGPVTISKPDFARALADQMLADLDAAEDDKQATEAVLQNRPLLAFVLDRIVPVVTSRYRR